VSTEFPTQKYTVKGNQEQAVRDLEIDPVFITPRDQILPWVREWPQNLKPEDLLPELPGSPQATKK